MITSEDPCGLATAIVWIVYEFALRSIQTHLAGSAIVAAHGIEQAMADIKALWQMNTVARPRWNPANVFQSKYFDSI